MKKYLSLIFLFILIGCDSTETPYGKFEQIKPSCDYSSSNEFSEKECYHETRYAFSFEITPDVLRMYYQEEIFSEKSYELHGKTLISEDDYGTYWVLFIESSELIHSTAFSYRRVSND